MARLLRVFGSLHIAVPLLITIAAVLAWGTIYETQFGTATVQRFIYRSWWFQGVLGFLAVNLAAAAVQRWPWQRKHVPFLLAHLGIILILLGGITSGRFGIEGQLVIPEGVVSDTLRLPQNVLVVHPLNPGRATIIPTQFETQAWVHEPRAAFEIPLEEGRVIQAVVDRYYPNAVQEELVANDGEEPHPAVHLRLARGDQGEGVWLWARDPQRFGAYWGEAHAFFVEPVTEEQLKRLVSQERMVPNAIIIVHAPAGSLLAILTDGEGRPQIIQPLRIGESYAHPALGHHFEVAAHYPRARRIRRFANRDNEVRAEALHLTLRLGDEEAATWLGHGAPAQVQLGATPVIVEYGQAQRRLPVAIRLLDFRKTDYPGTQMAAGFESDVELTDPERDIVLTRTIRMNSPLKHRGWTFYQASYLQGPVETTVLAVRKDPGTPFVYAGFLIVIAGVIWMFATRRPGEIATPR